MALVDLALFNGGTAGAYSPVLPGDLLLGADVPPRLVIKHTSGGNLDHRLQEQAPLTENQVDVVVGLGLVVVQAGHTLYIVPLLKFLRELCQNPLRVIACELLRQGDDELPRLNTRPLGATPLELLLVFPCEGSPKGGIGGVIGGV